jgi:2-iminoacetate synthase
MMSAGSHTEPGGYTGQGREALHLTVKGKIVPDSGAEAATEQFSISDDRDPRTVQSVLNRMGLEPIWKDWDEAILSAV